MSIHARTWIVAGLALWAGNGPVAAQDAYPTKQIQLIVPFAPGGAVDAVARVLATPLAATLGKPMVIDNRGGAGGVIGRSEEHTSELQSLRHLVCRLLL